MAIIANMPGSPGQEQPIPEYGGLLETSHVYNRRYEAAQSPEIRRLMAMREYGDRLRECDRLLKDSAFKGKIDARIHLEGGTGGNPLTCAFAVNVERVVSNGFRWAPALTLDALSEALRPVLTEARQAELRGEEEPPNSIRVSLRLEHYPPHLDFSNPTPRPFGIWPMVGNGDVGSIYWANDQNDHSGFGTIWIDADGRQFEKFSTHNLGYQLVKYKRVK